MSEYSKFFFTVKSFYDKGTLVYHQEFMPKSDSLNQVYLPYCHYALDIDGLISWLQSTKLKNVHLEWLDLALFNKDKAAVFAALASL
jgi:hypothetical protein